MAEYSEAFARYIMECKRSYEDVLAAIERGDVPPGRGAQITIQIPAQAVDRMRFDVIAAGVSNG
jgi:hypothetical protein